MANLASQPNLGDLQICVAMDKSGSTWGETLREEIKVVQNICRLLSPRNESPLLLLPWCDETQNPICLPKESTAMHNLVSGGGTNPVLYSSPACVQALSTCGLWFLLTDGQIEDELVQEFALSTAELELHGTACVIIVFGSSFDGSPANCDISVGVAAYAVAPHCLFLFHDVPTGKLTIMLVKGCFEKLLPKSGASYVLPTLGQYTTWAELPHITYEDLSCVQVPPPKKITADELALGNDLVVRMQDLYSGAADPETMGEIIKSQDNLKSIVLAEITRGKGKELHAWLQAQQKPLPELTRDRPDISGKAQQAVTLLLHSLKNGEPEEKLEKLRDDLRQAHTENWSQFRDILKGHDKSKRSICKSNTILQEASRHSLSQCSMQPIEPESETISRFSVGMVSVSYE